MGFFDSLGWHSDPKKIGSDVMNWIESIIGETAFPWLAASILTSTAFVFGAPLYKGIVGSRGKLGLNLHGLGVHVETAKGRTLIHLRLNLWSVNKVELNIVEWKIKLISAEGKCLGNLSRQIHDRAILDNIIHDDIVNWSPSVTLTDKPTLYLFNYYFDTLVKSPNLKFKIEATDSKGGKHKYICEYKAVLRT